MITRFAIVACLIVFTLVSHADSVEPTSVHLKFSELLANNTYRVTMKGVNLRNQEKVTHPHAVIEISNEEVLLTTASDFTGGILDVVLSIDPMSRFEANVDFPGSGKLRVEGVTSLSYSGSAIPITKVVAPGYGLSLPPTCVVAPQCNPETRHCPGRMQCYECGSFCEEVSYLCCGQDPDPPAKPE